MIRLKITIKNKAIENLNNMIIFYYKIFLLFNQIWIKK